MLEIIEKSKKIVLCKTKEVDLDYILQAEQHPDNSPYIGQWTREEHRNTFASDDILHLTVKSVCDSNPVGYVIMAGLQNPNRCMELRRIVITDKGKGYGRETLRLVKKLAFETLKTHRLWLDVREHNERAKVLYKSEGFVEEGKLRECILSNDSFQSLIILSILEDEYFSGF